MVIHYRKQRENVLSCLFLELETVKIKWDRKD
jgi:hypothetical protein